MHDYCWPYVLQVQYVEIYNEAIQDLLYRNSKAGAAGAPPGKLDIRERPSGEVFVEGATEVAAGSLKEVAGLLEAGSAVRQTAAHK